MKTDKRIEDYLHLYLGCEVIGKPYAGLPFTEKQHFTVRGVLTGVSKGCVTCHFVDINGVKWDQETRLVFQDVQPILRPLNSMTEEERAALWSVVFNGAHWRKFTGSTRWIPEQSLSSDPRWVLMQGVERLAIEMNGTVWADSDLHSYKHNQHEVTRWLLSKGFDLFSLIPSGLAIDKTTLK